MAKPSVNVGLRTDYRDKWTNYPITRALSRRRHMTTKPLVTTVTDSQGFALNKEVNAKFRTMNQKPLSGGFVFCIPHNPRQYFLEALQLLHEVFCT